MVMQSVSCMLAAMEVMCDVPYEVNCKYSHQPKCNLVHENVMECDRLCISKQHDIPCQSNNNL